MDALLSEYGLDSDSEGEEEVVEEKRKIDDDNSKMKNQTKATKSDEIPNKPKMKLPSANAALNSAVAIPQQIEERAEIDAKGTKYHAVPPPDCLSHVEGGDFIRPVAISGTSEKVKYSGNKVFAAKSMIPPQLNKAKPNTNTEDYKAWSADKRKKPRITTTTD